MNQPTQPSSAGNVPSESNAGGRRRTPVMIGRIVICVILAVIYMITSFIYSHTFVSLLAVLSVGLVAGAVSLPFMAGWWECLTRRQNRILNGVVHLVVVGVSASFVFLGMNYWGADASRAYSAELDVVQIGIDKHRSHSRGHRSVTTESFYMFVANEKSQVRKLRISRDRYNKLASTFHLGGKKVKVQLNEGMLGYVIIDKF